MTCKARARTIGRLGNSSCALTRRYTPRLDLRQTFVLANEFKEGDLLVGGADDARVRHEARRSLEALRLGEIGPAFVDDGVTEALERSLHAQSLTDVSGLTVGRLKQILLSPGGAAWIRRYRDGLRSEAIAAVVKVMDESELSAVARAIFNPHPGEGTTVGSPQHFGSRIQPNSPGDDEDDILLSILEGLTYGCGDVIIGLNPASDDVDTIVHLEDLLRRVVERLRLPTRYCVLSDIVKQTRARERAAVDVGFQSLAGTSKALAGMVGLDVDGILDLARGFPGCYFETGQGSAVTNGAAEGIDMVTLEARAYGVARYIQARTGAWTIVNDVAGFIGPEVFRTADQLRRACLEDVVMAKLHGLTMGLDVCATFHMGISPVGLAGHDSADRRAGRAGVPDGRGRQRGSDARIPHHLVPRAPAPSRSLGGPNHDGDEHSARDARRPGGRRCRRTRHRVALRGVRESRRRSTDDGRAARGRCCEDREPSRARIRRWLRPRRRLCGAARRRRSAWRRSTRRPGARCTPGWTAACCRTSPRNT